MQNVICIMHKYTVFDELKYFALYYDVFISCMTRLRACSLHDTMMVQGILGRSPGGIRS